MLRELSMPILVDFLNDQILEFKEIMLVNQLRGENEKKATAFDEKYQEQFNAMSAEYARLALVLWGGFRKLQADKATDTEQAAAASLLQHTMKTIEASIDLLRRGYRYQVGMLTRNAVEAIATVLCITIEPDTLEKVRKGKFESPKAISIAKRVVPLFGQLYGDLSSNFTHLNIDQFLWDPLLSQKDSTATEMCIMFAKVSLVLASLAAELVFYDQVRPPRFWREIAPDAYTYDPSAETLEWLEVFLRVGVVRNNTA